MTRASHETSDRGPLFDLAVRGDLQALRLLLEGGEPPERSPAPHYTPLQAAVCNGHIEVVRMLLLHGANAYHVDEKGWTALTHAIWYRRADLIALLREAGPPQTLRDAAGLGDLARARQLVEDGASINDDRNPPFQALYFALMGRHVGVARYLIEHGGVADSNLSILQAASGFGVVEIVEDQIAARGAGLAAEISGAMWEAASGDHVEVLRLLMDRFFVTRERLDYLLGRASCCSAVGTIRLLVERGADVNHMSDDGTPLDFAHGYSNDATVAALVALGATARRAE